MQNLINAQCKIIDRFYDKKISFDYYTDTNFFD